MEEGWERYEDLPQTIFVLKSDPKVYCKLSRSQMFWMDHPYRRLPAPGPDTPVWRLEF